MCSADWSQVSPVVRELGRFTSQADVDCIASVLQRWLHLLQFDLYEVSCRGGASSRGWGFAFFGIPSMSL